MQEESLGRDESIRSSLGRAADGVEVVSPANPVPTTPGRWPQLPLWPEEIFDSLRR